MEPSAWHKLCFKSGFYKNFVDGMAILHDAAVKNGATIVENLRVCCPTCNKSMGDQNLYQYIIDYDKKGDGHSNVKKYFRNNPDQLNDKRSNNFQKHKK